jgi:hypothetical protein
MTDKADELKATLQERIQAAMMFYMKNQDKDKRKGKAKHEERKHQQDRHGTDGAGTDYADRHGRE